MELEEMQSLWMQHDEKLNKSLELNAKLFREINFNKAGNKLKTLLFCKVTEMVILLFMLIYLWSFTINYFSSPGYSIPAFIILLFILSGFISDIKQLALIIKLQADSAAPVSQLQKKVERLRLLIINYVKISFISIPFYPLIMIVAAKIFFGVDFWLPRYQIFLTVNFITGLLLMLPFMWLYRQLSNQNIKQVWVNNFLSGAGWNQAILAQQFLNEIEAFEKDQ